MRSTTLGGAALATALTLALSAPAGADSVGVKDPADLGHGADLRSVVVDHGGQNVVITTTHTNLRPSFRSGSSGSVFIDTDQSDPGPEFAFVAGYYRGADYSSSTPRASTTAPGGCQSTARTGCSWTTTGSTSG
jgi:hypothetical protein